MSHSIFATRNLIHALPLTSTESVSIPHYATSDCLLRALLSICKPASQTPSPRALATRITIRARIIYNITTSPLLVYQPTIRSSKRFQLQRREARIGISYPKQGRWRIIVRYLLRFRGGKRTSGGECLEGLAFVDQGCALLTFISNPIEGR